MRAMDERFDDLAVPMDPAAHERLAQVLVARLVAVDTTPKPTATTAKDTTTDAKKDVD